ncbi:MAG: hypothetical protein QXW78_00275 [Candidatus Thermoplasmatota archaeon]
MHSEFQIKKNQFKENKTINEKWNAAVEEILKFKNRKRGGGDIDIAITDVDDGKDNLFLLCVEIKYFHYSLEAHRKDVEEELKKAYETLKILKEKGVTEEILMVIGNTYYKENNQRSMKPKEIEVIKKFISAHEDDVVYLEM